MKARSHRAAWPAADPDRIRALLRRAGLSQRGAARALGLTDRAVRLYVSRPPARHVQAPPSVVMVLEKMVREAERSGGTHDEWYTPTWVLQAVLRAAGRMSFTLDPCAHPPAPPPSGERIAELMIAAARRGEASLDLSLWSPSPAERQITKSGDGLKSDWSVGQGDLVWLNPPYSSKKQWLNKCINAAQGGADVVVLVPDGQGTAWWNGLVSARAQIVRPSKRIAFVGPDGEVQESPPQKSVLLVYGPHATTLAPRINAEIEREIAVRRADAALRSERRKEWRRGGPDPMPDPPEWLDAAPLMADEEIDRLAAETLDTPSIDFIKPTNRLASQRKGGKKPKTENR